MKKMKVSVKVDIIVPDIPEQYELADGSMIRIKDMSIGDVNRLADVYSHMVIDIYDPPPILL